jgi:hypothetical protein
MNINQALAFVDELEKQAVAPGLLKRLMWNSGIGRSAAGAAVGAGTGALAAGPDDRLRGALLGGAAGGALGLASPLVTSAGRQKAKEWVSRTGKNQWHSLTGRGRLQVAPGTSAADLSSLRKSEAAGLTSLPGTVKGLLGKDRGKVLGEAWRQSGTMGKVMAAGDIALSAPRILDNSTAEGTGEKALSTLGSSGAYFLGGKMPIVGNMLLAAGAGTAGKYLGRGIDKIVGHKAPVGSVAEGPVVVGRPGRLPEWKEPVRDIAHNVAQAVTDEISEIPGRR